MRQTKKVKQKRKRCEQAREDGIFQDLRTRAVRLLGWSDQGGSREKTLMNRQGIKTNERKGTRGRRVSTKVPWRISSFTGPKKRLNWCAGASQLNSECEIQVFKFCLASIEEMLKTAQVNVMKTLEVYD